MIKVPNNCSPDQHKEQNRRPTVPYVIDVAVFAGGTFHAFTSKASSMHPTDALRYE